MSTDTLDKTSLLDIDKLKAEMREAHRLLRAHGMDHYWTPNVDTFMLSLEILKSKMTP